MINQTLPIGWEWKTLGDVCQPPQYGWTTSATATGKLRLLRTTDITSGSITWERVPFCSVEPVDIAKYLLNDGDIVISRAGSVGYSILVKNPIAAVFASYLIRFRPKINEKYVSYFLQSPDYWQSISEKRLGIAIPNVNATKLKQIPIPVPPLPEQERIVERIESLFTQLDAGVAGLKRLKEVLKRYKASVLKSACEGRLVPQDPLDEPAEAQMRRHSHEPLWENDLPELPRGWCWATIEQIVLPVPGSIQSGPFGSDLHHSEFQDMGILVIGIDNVQDGIFSLGKQHRISLDKYSQLKKFTARPFDVLITVMATVGRCCVIPSNTETAIITKHVYRMSTDHTLVDPYYLMYNLLGGEEVRKQLFRQVRGQTRPGINGSILRVISIPLAPLEEQYRIIAEIDRRLSVVHDLEKTIDANLKRAERLRQAILKQAFIGRF